MGKLVLKSKHRLLCGDCRDEQQVDRLFGEDMATIVFTSPPYASQRKYDESSGFQPIPPDEYSDWWDGVQANVRRHITQDGSFFVNIKEHCEDGQRHLYVKDLAIAHVRRWGWMFVDEFCWRDTKNGVPGGWNNRFKDAWEPVFHFAMGEIKFRPAEVSQASGQCFDYSPGTGRSANGSGLKSGAPAGGLQAGLARPSNVLEIPAADGKDGHSAAFPMALPSFFIKAYSDPGDFVYEPFCGSGTTLIAAEQLGRRCMASEISPAYCDIIVSRWERMTGRHAVLEPAL